MMKQLKNSSFARCLVCVDVKKNFTLEKIAVKYFKV